MTDASGVEEFSTKLIGLIPRRFRAAKLTEPAVAAWVETLVQQEHTRPAWVNTGPSLLLLGGTGTGKTHQAYAAVRTLSESGVRVSWVFVNAADMYASLRPRTGVDSEAQWERLAYAGVLVLDDLGAAKTTEWTEEVNYRLINHRYEWKRPTLLTSNVPPGQLASALGERVASRLTEMASRVVLAGKDRRYGLP